MSAPAVTASASALPSASASSASTDFVFEIRDAATHAPMPGKVTFVGVSGTPSPGFTTSDEVTIDDRSVRAWNRVMTLTGMGRLQVPKGTYDVYLSRGPEWSMHVSRGLALGEREVTLQAELTHEVPTPGWISGDFHVHAERSWDSKVPMKARVVEFVAEGVDLIVATDHNAIADYAPMIRDLGAGDLLASLRGDEITTRDWGHFGVFPLGDVQPFATKKRTPVDILREVREKAPDALIDVNHPRFDRGLGYFRTGIFDRAQAKFGRSGGSLDFDAVEILNGYEGSRPDQVDDVMKDWFALLGHGHRVAAMGNSDTHRLDTSLAGYPRNFIPVASDAIATLSPPEVIGAIKRQRSYLTTAPLLELSAVGAATGDTLATVSGRATVHVRVRAASWVGVDTLTIYVGDEVALTRALAPGGVVRFDEDVSVDVPRDAWIVARAEGKAPLPPIVGGGARPGEPALVAYPIAVTNPIFVDADGDGRSGD